MNETTVKTQHELDAALKAGIRLIYVSTQVDDVVAVPGTGSSRVVARDSSRVVARGSSRVVAWDSSRVVAWDSSSVVARDSSSVVAWDSSRVEAWGSSSVVARDSSRVEARDSSSVEARDSSRVEAWGSSRVEAWDSSSVEATTFVAVQIRHRHCGTVRGGVQISVPDFASDAKSWAEAQLMPAVRGRVTVYKAVDQGLCSGRGFAYPIGETVSCEDWDQAARCGAGLHFSPSPRMAQEYINTSAPRFLECTVAVKDLVPLGDDKCKAPSCRVVREVDVWGDPVAVREEER